MHGSSRFLIPKLNDMFIVAFVVPSHLLLNFWPTAQSKTKFQILQSSRKRTLVGEDANKIINGQISVDGLTVCRLIINSQISWLEITYKKLQAFARTFTVSAISLTIGRYAIRWHKFHAFGWDDLLHGIATILMVILISIYAPYFLLYYKVEYYAAGVGPKPTEAELEQYFHIELTNSMIFWVVMYTVKFIFTALYRHVFGVSRTFMRVWWVVFGFTAITFFICFLSDLWVCGHPSDLGNLSKFNNYWSCKSILPTWKRCA